MHHVHSSEIFQEAQFHHVVHELRYVMARSVFFEEAAILESHGIDVQSPGGHSNSDEIDGNDYGEQVAADQVLGMVRTVFSFVMETCRMALFNINKTSCIFEFIWVVDK